MKEILAHARQWMPADFGAPVRICLILILAAIALHGVHRILPRLREAVAARQASEEDSKRIRTLSRVLRYVLTVATTVVAALLVLGELGISIAPILGAAGVVGIAVGFGAQSLVKDYFTGFFLLLENQIRHGDVVEAGGRSGVVEELTLRYLRLRDYSGNVHFIPNGRIDVVTNMSSGYAYAVVDVSIAYESSIERALGVMREVGCAMRADPLHREQILDDPEIAGVEQLADSSIILRCRIRVTPLSQWSVRRTFLREIKNAFDSAGVEIPYPRLVLKRDSGSSPVTTPK